MNNPILGLINDDLYAMLLELNLLNKKALRDIEIKRQYLALRTQGNTSMDSIEMVLNQYPYLQFDTLRKIIYSVRLPEDSAKTQCA